MLGFAVLSESVPEEPPNIEPCVPVYDSDEPTVCVDVAVEFTFAPEPTYNAPCERSDNLSPFRVVDENAIRPFVKLNIDDVEFPNELNGKMLFTKVEVEIVVTFPSVIAVTIFPYVQGVDVPRPPPEPPEPVIVIGDEPITLNVEQVTEPEQVTDVVATVAKVPDVIFVYSSWLSEKPACPTSSLGATVVPRVAVRVPDTPPRNEPAVPVYESPVPNVGVDVETPLTVALSTTIAT